VNPAGHPSLRRKAVIVSRRIAVALALVCVAQVVGIGLLVRDNFAHKDTIRHQDEEIRRLKERLRVLEVIEDLHTNLTPEEETHLAAHVDQCSRSYGFDPLLVLAIIQVESSFGPRAISSKGACGLMQVKPSTARAEATRLGWEWAGDHNLFKPALNVRVGIEYLSKLVSKFGSVEKALIAYNHGETAVRGWLSDGLSLPQAYLRRVQSEYRRLQSRYDPTACPNFIGPPSP
jgi:soluble lytic murein transglycosylase